jgi:N-acetylglucosamine-6-phosphate deacetylase
MKTIDIHTHGIGGFDTRTTAAEDILQIARLHSGCGVSTILPTIYSAPIAEMQENMAAAKEAMEVQVTGYKLQVTGSTSGTDTSSARILGVHLEGPFLNPTRCGALDQASLLSPTPDNLKRLIQGFEDLVKIITLAPELEGATRLIKAIADMGIIVSMGHSDATYTEAEAGFHAGAKGITHIFNAMRSIHHREPGIAGFGLMNSHIYVEVIADPFHLHPETIKLIFANKDPGRIIIVSDSVKETGVKIGEHGRENRGRGKRSGQRTDASHGIRDSRGILRGGSMAIAESARRLLQSGIEEDLIMPCITSNPSSYLGRP